MLLTSFCLLSLQTQGTRWFLILAGAILGFTAALLWSAQGAIMMSYPLEKDKGKAFGIFWAIFQFGSFIGAVIAMAINIKNGGLSRVATSTYIVRLYISAIVPNWYTSSTYSLGLLYYHPHRCRILAFGSSAKPCHSWRRHAGQGPESVRPENGAARHVEYLPRLAYALPDAHVLRFQLLLRLPGVPQRYRLRRTHSRAERHA